MKRLTIFLAIFLLIPCVATADHFRDVWLNDGAGNPIGSHIEPGNTTYSLNIHNAHVHTVLINERFRKDSGTSELLTVAASTGDISVTVAAGGTFAVGNEVILYEGTTEEHTIMTITIVAGNLVTLDRPLEHNFTTAASLEITEVNMASVAGTLAAPRVYLIVPPAGEVWHINRILVHITDQTAMDDSLFGGIAAVTNGTVLRQETSLSDENLSNWKNNGDFVLDSYDVHYALKAPAGFYGLRVRWTFEKASVVIRLDGDQNDELRILVQDDLTGLDTFCIKAQGHIEQ